MELLLIMAIFCHFTSTLGKDLISSRYRNGSRKRLLSSLVCNRTFQGSIGNVYSLGILRSITHKTTGTDCTYNITAGGGKLGDIIQITVLSLNIGPHTQDGCLQGQLSIWEPSLQQKPSGGWCGGTISEYNPLEFYSRTSTVSIALLSLPSSVEDKQQLLHMEYRLISGNLTAPLKQKVKEFVSDDPQDSCLEDKIEGARFQSRSKKAPYFGEDIPNTICDKVFLNCEMRNCVLVSPNWPGTPPRGLVCHYSISRMPQRKENSTLQALHSIIQLGPSKTFNLKYPGRVHLDLNRNYFKSGEECNKSMDIDWMEIRKDTVNESSTLMLLCESNYLQKASFLVEDMVVVYHSAKYDSPLPTRIYQNGFVIPLKIRKSHFLTSIPETANKKDAIKVRVRSSSVSKFGILENPDFHSRDLTQVSFIFEGFLGERILFYFSRFKPLFNWELSTQKRSNAVIQILDGLGDDSRLIANFSNEAHPPLCEHISSKLLQNCSYKWSETNNTNQNNCRELRSSKFCYSTLPLSVKKGRNKREVVNSLRLCALENSFITTTSTATLKVLLGNNFNHPSVYYTLHYGFISSKMEYTTSNQVLSSKYAVLNTSSEVVIINKTLEFMELDSYFSDSSKVNGFGQCDFTLKESSYGALGSPSAYLFYGSGGKTSLTCHYRFKPAQDRILTLLFENFTANVFSCENFLDVSGRWICVFKRPNYAALYIYEIFDNFVMFRRHCICSSVEMFLFKSISSHIVLRYEVRGMTRNNGPREFNFRMSYSYTDNIKRNYMLPSLSRNGIISLRECNSGIKSPSCSQDMVIPIALRYSNYIRIAGSEMHNEDICPSEDRVFIYSSRELISVICPKKNANETVEIYSDTVKKDVFYKMMYVEIRGTSCTVDIIRIERSYSHQEKKPELSYYSVNYQFKTDNFSVHPCQFYCPEFYGCINPLLWCDGQIHCPKTGLDEINCKELNIHSAINTLERRIVYILVGSFTVVLIAIIFCMAHFSRKRRPRHNQSLKMNSPRLFTENYI
ncbi:uncharacterized protein LOC136029983 isoform X2 [Artemia franciscana]|nr:hypothetical protein QYM36_007721 [Artemia franciscana]